MNNNNSLLKKKLRAALEASKKNKERVRGEEGGAAGAVNAGAGKAATTTAITTATNSTSKVSSVKHASKVSKAVKTNTPPALGKGQLSTLQEKMAKKLAGSKFRWINETLYTKESKESLKIFQDQPELFTVYHEGFASQVQAWPVNPVDVIIEYLSTSYIKSAAAAALEGKPIVVADMGCGEAQIAKVLSDGKRGNFKIHSFDLVKGNEHITACDIAKVPLKGKCVDVAVFALSLMGTNFVDFLKEANRILKDGGELKVAEVVSRIENLHEFIKGVQDLGFKLIKKDTTNKMFVLMDFKKTRDLKEKATLPPSTTNTIPALKPCIYKRR